MTRWDHHWTSASFLSLLEKDRFKLTLRHEECFCQLINKYFKSWLFSTPDANASQWNVSHLEKLKDVFGWLTGYQTPCYVMLKKVSFNFCDFSLQNKLTSRGSLSLWVGKILLKVSEWVRRINELIIIIILGVGDFMKNEMNEKKDKNLKCKLFFFIFFIINYDHFSIFSFFPCFCYLKH